MVSTTIPGWCQQLYQDGFNNYTWMVSTTILGWFPHLDDYSQLITWMVSTTMPGWFQQLYLDGFLIWMTTASWLPGWFQQLYLDGCSRWILWMVIPTVKPGHQTEYPLLRSTCPAPSCALRSWPVDQLISYSTHPTGIWKLFCLNLVKGEVKNSHSFTL